MRLHYDPQNLELRVIVDEIRRVGDAVANVRWVVQENQRVAAGDLLGHLQWNMTDDTELRVPAECGGVVVFINRNILSVGNGIAEHPAKVLLRLGPPPSDA